jgi:hypothetical protein
MPKLPGKFDDLNKASSSLIGDDFIGDKSKQKALAVVKTKQKTNLDGATAEIQVDVLGGAKDPIKTPAKLTMKFPKPFTFLPGFAIDKFELTPNSSIALDCSADKTLHKIDALKTELKGKLDSGDFTGAVTYTGIADTSVKCEITKKANQDIVAAIQGLKAECLRSVGPAVVGFKFDAKTLCPDVGANMAKGDLTGAIIAKSKFTEFSPSVHYNHSKDLQVAAAFQVGGKNAGQWDVAAITKVADVTTKCKISQNMTAQVAFKKELAKGTTFFGGVAYNINSGSFDYGCKLNIE